MSTPLEQALAYNVAFARNKIEEIGQDCYVIASQSIHHVEVLQKTVKELQQYIKDTRYLITR